jgi:hypothetical protein
MKSAMKIWAERREKDFDVQVCPYSQARLDTVIDTLKEFDAILWKYPEEKKSIETQRSTYIRQFFLIQSLYPLFDEVLEKNKETIIWYLSSVSFPESSPLKDRNYSIRVNAMHIYWYIFAKKIQKGCMWKENTCDFQFNSYLKDFTPRDNFPLYKAWKIVLDMYMENINQDSPEKYQDKEFLEKVTYSFLEQAYLQDIQDWFLDETSFETYENYRIALQKTFIGNKIQPLFLNIISDYWTSFQILYAMIGSICEELMEYEEFRILSDQDKYKMLKSIKRDFLVEARFWSLYFLNDNQGINQLTNMLWFTPEMSTMPRWKILMDFENLEISLDESTYPNNPVWEGKIIRRWCPVAFVSGKNLWWNFLARQIDFAIDIHTKIALWLKVN